MTTSIELPRQTLVVDRTLVMGVLNATSDSFSDAGRYSTATARLERADHLIEAHADIIDVGGQSAVTVTPPLEPKAELDAVLPVIEHIIARSPSAIISVDTYKPVVAEGVLKAGAAIINDTTGLRDHELASVVADHRAALVITHNRGRPKQRLTDPDFYDDVVDDVTSFLQERAKHAERHGVKWSSLIFDPGPDFSKTPAQTVAVLQGLAPVAALGRPLLVALSKKDFIGAITLRPPDQRLGGTLAAIAYVLDTAPPSIIRVHDVDQVRDYLKIRSVLSGDLDVDPALDLPPHLRRL